MMSDSQLMFKVADLVLHYMDGTLDEDGLRRLEELLEKNPLAVEYYTEILWTHVGLNTMEGISCLQNAGDKLLDEDLWKALRQEEQTAPALQIQPEDSPKTPKSKIIYTRDPRPVSKWSLVTAIVSVAALLFLVVLIRFTPNRLSPEVATLTDSIGADWTDSDAPISSGTRLLADATPRRLRQGLARLQFDNNAQVIIEAPAEFQILAEDRIGLLYGKVYAVVPEEAAGFSVYTPNAKVIDFGTEFGVQAALTGDTCLHVIKGKTMLIAGEQADRKNRVEVAAGSAKKIARASAESSDIPCSQQLFVRAIDSKSNLIWKGQSVINLADIVSGGNGLGTGRQKTQIDMKTGNLVWESAAINIVHKLIKPVASNPLIDCVFTLKLDDPSTPITSDGRSCQPGVLLNGYGSGNITAGPWLESGQETYWMLDGKPCGTPGVPAIYLHANKGITFDLQAIRRQIPAGRLSRFTAIGGVAQQASMAVANFNEPAPVAGLLVLVDGTERFRKDDVSYLDRPIPLDIPLRPQDRFLTLITHNGTDSSTRWDWCLFAQPFLHLETQ